VTARLATQSAVSARAPEVLRGLIAAGVDVEEISEPVPAKAADLLEGVREGHLDMAAVGLCALRGAAADGLTMLAALPREDPRDALVAVAGPPAPLRSLPAGSRVGVAGSRRRAFLKAHRADLQAVEIPSASGAPPVGGGERLAAAVVAAADVRRLGLAERTGEVLDARSWLPAPGQGMVALMARHPIAEVTALDHLPSRTALRAELALLDALELDAGVGFGSLAQPSGRLLRLWAAVVSPDGSRLVRSDLTGPLDEPELLGAAVARQLVRRGADLLLVTGATR
jgi:hydroxymethylbilane synthase